MILPDTELHDWADCYGLSPFDAKCINPASVDLRWSGKYREQCYHDGWSDVMEASELIMQPSRLMLLDTLEMVHMPNDCCGVITLKSSIGRMGLEHLHAGFVDPGFIGTLTLELCNLSAKPISLKREQRIVQLTLMRMEYPPNKIYSGRYQHDNQPTPNK